ncbi:unnamed protein product [marine sediment metagenome]|uniref:Uncharacterized protein n=1 Tax=marine sediment metagenome TaxID=412755 RepID=X0VGR3_9ZZZZ
MKKNKTGEIIIITNRKQAKNPITQKWVKFDTSTGKTISHKKTSGPYKRVEKVK